MFMFLPVLTALKAIFVLRMFLPFAGYGALRATFFAGFLCCFLFSLSSSPYPNPFCASLGHLQLLPSLLPHCSTSAASGASRRKDPASAVDVAEAARQALLCITLCKIGLRLPPTMYLRGKTSERRCKNMLGATVSSPPPFLVRRRGWTAMKRRQKIRKSASRCVPCCAPVSCCASCSHITTTGGHPAFFESLGGWVPQLLLSNRS